MMGLALERLRDSEIHVLIYIYMVPPPWIQRLCALKGLFGFTSVTQHTIGGSMEGGFIAIGRRV